MSTLEEMIRLNAREEVAWKKWEETQDTRYLKAAAKIIAKRSDLLDLRKFDFAASQEAIDEKKR